MRDKEKPTRRTVGLSTKMQDIQSFGYKGPQSRKNNFLRFGIWTLYIYRFLYL